jgi:RNA polymerase sigma-70 factor, ECF subfamily
VSTHTPEELARWCQLTLPDDTRAFEALLAQYKRPVFATARRLMGNDHDAEDQAQEIFLKIYRHIRDLDAPATLPAWIHRIAVNTCLDALERQKRRPAAPLPSAGEDEEAAYDVPDRRTPSPADAAEERERLRCIEAALSKLDPHAHAVILLRDVEDHPYEEIARQLQLGLSAVKMRIHRARLRMQELFRELCPGLWPRGTARRA